MGVALQLACGYVDCFDHYHDCQRDAQQLLLQRLHPGLGYGGYVGFETFTSYRDSYSLKPLWILAATLPSFFPSAALVTALSWLLKCKHLWAANEKGAVDPQQRLQQKEAHRH